MCKFSLPRVAFPSLGILGQAFVRYIVVFWHSWWEKCLLNIVVKASVVFFSEAFNVLERLRVPARGRADFQRCIVLAALPQFRSSLTASKLYNTTPRAHQDRRWADLIYQQPRGEAEDLSWCFLDSALSRWFQRVRERLWFLRETSRLSRTWVEGIVHNSASFREGHGDVAQGRGTIQ